MKPNIAVIGPGRLGQAITARLRQQGYPITAVVGRDQQRTRAAACFIGAEFVATTQLKRCAPADIIFITTPDHQLAGTAHQLQASCELRPQTILIHCSGLHPAAILQPAKMAGKNTPACLSMHPLQTFASAELGVQALAGSYFSLEGDPTAIKFGKQLVADLAGSWFIIDAQSKPLYHAAACMASNFITTVLAAVSDTLQHCGEEDDIPLAAMKPLIETAVTNTLAVGAETALTGPIVRGDSETVAKHLKHLKKADPQLEQLYQCLAQHTTRLAGKSQRLSPQAAAIIEEIILNH